MVGEHGAEDPSRWATVSSIAAKIGCSAHTLHEYVKKAEVDNSKREVLAGDVTERMKALERENRELRQANEILCKASANFARAELVLWNPWLLTQSGAFARTPLTKTDTRPPVQAMISFIDEHRAVLGGEPICRLLPIARSIYYEFIAKRTDMDRLSARARRDIAMRVEICRVFNENFQVYGARKVWRQLQRKGYDIARCGVR